MNDDRPPMTPLKEALNRLGSPYHAMEPAQDETALVQEQEPPRPAAPQPAPEPPSFGPDQIDELHAYAVNAVLHAKGIEQMLTPYEAAKIWIIASHLEELAVQRFGS